MPNIYWRFAEHAARLADAKIAEDRAARRMRAARQGRQSAESARTMARETAVDELNRQLACGLITKAEHKRRTAALDEEVVDQPAHASPDR